MIKKKAINRIFVSSVAIFIVFAFVSLNLVEDKDYLRKEILDLIVPLNKKTSCSICPIPRRKL